MGAASTGASAGAKVGYKTKADGTLGIFGVVNKAIGQYKTAAQIASSRIAPGKGGAAAGALVGINRTPIVPSKPVPPPTTPFVGAAPKRPQNNADIQKAIQEQYDHIARGIGKITGAFGGATQDSAYQQAQNISNLSVPGKKLYNEVSDYAKTIAGALPGVKDYHAPTDRPNDQLLDELSKQVDAALRDNTWSPDERMQIVKQYRSFVDKYTANDEDDLKAINNWAVQSEFKRLVQQWHNKTVDADSKFHADTSDGLWASYDGTLASESDDDFGPGFLLAQDEGGWFKIQNIQDVQHQIESEMRKNPAAAAQLIARMTAWGAYGGAQEKYSKNNVVFDSHGNPIKARWTKDDQTALRQLLKDIAKDQETAMNAGELQPWDIILDQQSVRNDTISDTPGYADQSGGGGGYRRYGRGYGGYGGGGGGGGGVSYTDADQLKQLVNGIARARLGYVLNDEQVAEFVAQYHQKEAAFVQARVAGQDGQQLDPESQAAAWIESHFRDQMAAQQGNSYISALASFLLNGSFGSTS